ncbi:transporter substrate-binding domain-containing protein [Vibrio nomapromontoriensis]|uniref:transporter substrate-binding domain-containing protein n=1 Tax=Vibrio nomapromontoriensis TaxID=2910246 RepID=UPI003D11912E
MLVSYTIRFSRLLMLFTVSSIATANDLTNVLQRGELRHIGVQYANFVKHITINGQLIVSGLDVDILKGFAQHLGVEYRYIPARWDNVIPQLNGTKTSAPKGDIIGNGFTILSHRQAVIEYSNDYFPSAVWVVSRTDSALNPITPTQNISTDINSVKALLNNQSVLTLENSCLDPALYNLESVGAKVKIAESHLTLNQMIPALLNEESDTTLIDVADALIALEKWPGQIKVLGPISDTQKMAFGFNKNSHRLRQAFNRYLSHIKSNGELLKLVNHYYPSVHIYYGDYFTSYSSP